MSVVENVAGQLFALGMEFAQPGAGLQLRRKLWEVVALSKGFGVEGGRMRWPCLRLYHHATHFVSWKRIPGLRCEHAPCRPDHGPRP